MDIFCFSFGQGNCCVIILYYMFCYPVRQFLGNVLRLASKNYFTVFNCMFRVYYGLKHTCFCRNQFDVENISFRGERFDRDALSPVYSDALSTT